MKRREESRRGERRGEKRRYWRGWERRVEVGEERRGE